MSVVANLLQATNLVQYDPYQLNEFSICINIRVIEVGSQAYLKSYGDLLLFLAGYCQVACYKIKDKGHLLY